MSQQYEYPLPPPPPSPRHSSSSPGAGPYPSASGSASAGSSFGGGSHGQQSSRPVSSAQLPSITTAFLGRQGPITSQASTPVSTTHLSPGVFPYAPATPSALNPRTPGGLVPPSPAVNSPRSPAMEPYNPRQWSSRGHVSGSQMVFQQRQSTGPTSTNQVTGMEGVSVLLLHIMYLVVRPCWLLVVDPAAIRR